MSETTDAPRELLLSTKKADPDGVLVAVRDSGPGLRQRHFRGCSTPSTPPRPTEWEWASRSAARLSKPMVGGCGRPGASRGVLSFSLLSPLTEPPSAIDVAYCALCIVHCALCRVSDAGLCACADAGMQAGGRRPKPSKGGNRGSERRWRREAPAYGDLAIGRAAASGLGGVFSRRARAAAVFGTGGSRSNGGSAARRSARLAARIGFGAKGWAPTKAVVGGRRSGTLRIGAAVMTS